MTNETHRRSFWASLPGVLTGVASLTTAAVAALTFVYRDRPAPQPAETGSLQQPGVVAPKRTEPVEKQSTPPSNAIAMPADDPERDVASCQRIAGKWVWSTGGIVNIGGDGSLQWRPRATDPLPTVTGRWVCTDPQQSEYLFSWSHGFTDVFVLSADARRVNGTNQQTNTPLFGNRQD